MKNVLTLFFTLISIYVQAQIFENPYNAHTIPDSLRQNATVVLRKYSVDYAVKTDRKAIRKEHRIVTLLKDGSLSDFYSSPYLAYDKLRAITHLEAFLYDGNGKLVQPLKKKDIQDQKMFDAWVDDNRYKILNFPRLAYPYTIEYKVEYEEDETMFYPNFYPQEDPDIAVQNATLDISIPSNTLRYKEMNMADDDKVSINNNTYSWHFKPIKAFKQPAFAPSAQSYLPHVMTAPHDFAMGNYKGNMSSWSAYGQFLNQLGKDRQVLTVKTVDSLKKMVADCRDTACIVEKLYAHLQNTTRYFSIQLGIGGWQPFPANEVDRKKYGDCKALSNYMVAMLAAVGVKGTYVIIRANDPVQYADFPNPFFNHAIACVPMAQDTIWLECTSQKASCGFMGSFTDNRLALLVDETGGKVVHTPKYDEKVNTIYKKSRILLDSLGNATIQGENQYAGVEAESLEHIAEKDESNQRKHFYKSFKINQFNIKKLVYNRHKTRIPTVDEHFELSVDKLASVNGQRLFLPINLFSVWNAIPMEDSARQYEVQADDRGFTQIDSVIFELPIGFKLESKYAPIQLDSDFGQYEMKVIHNKNQILFFRKLILNNKIFKKEKYGFLNDFLRQVIKADKSKLVLVKN
jgi:hypothetical protein